MVVSVLPSWQEERRAAGVPMHPVLAVSMKMGFWGRLGFVALPASLIDII